MKALLIDDEPLQRKLLASQLANIGIADAICCEAAKPVLNLLTGGTASVDLDFCDLPKPRMVGLEDLLAWMRARQAICAELAGPIA